MKQLLRILAIDDGYFIPRKKGKTVLVGVVSRLDGRVEGMLSTDVKVDGLDSTAKIISMLRKSKFLSQVSFLVLDGVNFAGFNIVDLGELKKKLGIPIIIVFRRKPRMQKIEAALARFRDGKKRMRLIAQAGKIYKARNIFFQCFGCEAKTARAIILKTIQYSNLPEPLRLAHIVASAVTRGESTRP